MPTLNPDVLLSDTLEAFKTRFPMLSGMSTDFRATPLKLDTEYIAHIETLPTAATYDTTTGYANGATSGRSLLTDVPITVDTHKHVPVKLEHLNAIKDHQQKYGRLVGNCGYVLGKTMIDSVTRMYASTERGHSHVAYAHPRAFRQDRERFCDGVSADIYYTAFVTNPAALDAAIAQAEHGLHEQ